MLPLCYIFCTIWIKFITGDVHKNVLSDYESHENQFSKSRTFLRGKCKFLPTLATFSVQFG
jgi:hypothetical protein